MPQSKRPLKNPARGDERPLTAGAAPPTRETVERRARETALIEHPETPGVTPADRARAYQEMTTTGDFTSSTDASASLAASRDPADPPAPEAKVHREVEPEDAQQELESMVIEGTREAEHDRMLASRKAERRESSGADE